MRASTFRRWPAAIALAALVVALPLPAAVVPSGAQTTGTGTVTGLVFQDFNANGVYDTTVVSGQATDIGVAGVTVRAFDRTGALVGTTTSGADGTYEVTVTDADSDDVRIEFSLPTSGPLAALEPSFFGTAAGASNGTTVQFVTLSTASATGVDLAVNVPGEYCQSNPYLAISRLCAGKGGAVETSPTVFITRYDGGPYDTSTALTNGFTSWTANTAATKSGTGSLLGMAWDAGSGRVFNTAYLRRHADMFEIDGKPVPGALFVTSPNGTRPGDLTGGSTAFLVDLETLLAGDRFSDGSLPTNAQRRLDCIEAISATVGACTVTDGIDSMKSGYVGVFEAVGRTGIGDIETDGERLWVVSLYDRNLYEVALPADGSAPTTMRSLGSIVAPVTCTNGEGRPFSVRLWRGALYLGVVCDGAQDFDEADPWTVKDANLSFTILRFDLGAETFSTFFGPHPLNAAGKVEKGWTAGSGAAAITQKWNPWTDFYPSDGIGGESLAVSQTRFNQRPVPMLSEIEFDRDGSMILGFRDRTGDQSTTNGSWTPTGGVTGYPTIASGDIYRVCRVGAGFTAADYAFEGTHPDCSQTVNTPAGNGVEFYSADAWLFTQDGSLGTGHGEISAGMLAQVPGFPDVIMSGFDPYSGPSNGITVFYSGGIRYLSNATGGPAGFPNDGDGVMFYSSEPPLNVGPTWAQTGPQVGGFLKVNGMSDVEALCDLAPVQIGNRVWFDTNKDGLQDPGEESIAGVTVRLYDASGTLVGTAITDQDGTYYFSSNVTKPAAGDGSNVGGGLTVGGTFTIRLDEPADYAEGGPLHGYTLTLKEATSSTPEVRAVAVDSNAAMVDGWPTIAVPARTAGVNDHTFDVGFFVAASDGSSETPSNTPTGTDGPTGTGDGGIVGGPIPTRVPAGEGPVGVPSLLALIAGGLALLARGVLRSRYTLRADGFGRR
jgi:hypothetical protein